jgi:hypothetical protein
MNCEDEHLSGTEVETITISDVKSRSVEFLREHNEAVEFLPDVLANGALSATEVYETAENSDVARVTLACAKKALNVKSIKEGAGWMWPL